MSASGPSICLLSQRMSRLFPRLVLGVVCPLLTAQSLRTLAHPLLPPLSPLLSLLYVSSHRLSLRMAAQLVAPSNLRCKGNVLLICPICISLNIFTLLVWTIYRRRSRCNLNLKFLRRHRLLLLKRALRIISHQDRPTEIHPWMFRWKVRA